MTGDSDSDSANAVDVELVLACESGDLAKVQHLVEQQDGDVCYQDPETGISVLMVAASAGHTQIVRYLLNEGAPWNAVDRTYMCAGDYAAKHGQQECIDALMGHAVTSELLLSLAMQKEESEDTDDIFFGCPLESPVFANTGVKHVPSESLNASYLSSRLQYTENGHNLVDTSTNLAVMMDWELPLMKRHAAWICHADSHGTGALSNTIRVLNVGFGMGIVDEEIQAHRPSSHVIIEAHPEVLRKMECDGWMTKDGVQVLRGRWQEVVPTLAQEIADSTSPPFDGIFFDTYAEDDLDLREFHTWLPKLLRRVAAEDEGGTASVAGRYSYYNGVCPDNVFFHGVACETIRLHLKRLGIDCQFEPIPVDVSDPKLWKDLSRRYWYFDTYFLPKCTFQSKETCDTN
ncbi:unnamed protein product [Dicrocoelium dendriticum]|nr:unnamed protein product [Dicrocoelium dendriticum]